MSSRLLRLLAALLASALVLGACGGDDDEPDDDTSGTTSTSITAAPEDDDDESDDESETDTTEADETGTDTTEVDEPDTDDGAAGFDVESLAAIDDFCELDQYADQAFDALVSDTPEQARAGAEFMGAFFMRANQIAPEPIKGDMQQLTAALAELYEAAADFDYDINAMMLAAENDPELQERLAVMEDPALEAADDNVSAWVDANCAE